MRIQYSYSLSQQWWARTLLLAAVALAAPAEAVCGGAAPSFHREARPQQAPVRMAQLQEPAAPQTQQIQPAQAPHPQPPEVQPLPPQDQPATPHAQPLPPAAQIPQPPPGKPAAPLPQVSSAAERIFSGATSRLLQIRTTVYGPGRQSSVGSAFLVSADGIAITNYHVVSQAAFEPDSYKLEYIAADGSRGDAKLLAIDLAHDLAVLRVDKRDAPYFTFSAASPANGLAKGERLYSMGNPLDLGFTIVEGTYNGLVERTYEERILFSGALNHGMSGGPAVTSDGQIVGVNVAKSHGSEQLSFLVPGRYAAALLARAQAQGYMPPKNFRTEIGRQLAEWQAGFYKSLVAAGFHQTAFGPYHVPETDARWFNCWSNTNAGGQPKPRVDLKSTSCSSGSSLFVSRDLTTGRVQVSHLHARAAKYNQFQFAAFLSIQLGARHHHTTSSKWFTQRRCHEDVAAAAPGRPPLLVVWCAAAYRDFEGLYDVSVTAVTQDRGSEALVSRLTMQAVGYDTAMALTRTFIEAIR